ncbi:sulfatase [Akkermansiaceae bacterium]|nr:sulfatase [Akkermansiaceae bacterium]
MVSPLREAGRALTCIVVGGILSVSVAFAEEKDRPNILFIMSDDHTTQAVGAYGSRLAKLNPTPNIDRLAKNGMRFDRVYCNNSICTPSRASIITGQYSQTNGVLDLGGNIPPERQFLPLEMRKLGYETAMIGKWHLKQEPASFDYYCVLPGQGNYHNPDFRIRGDKAWPKNAISKRGQHSSDAITDITLKWLSNGRDNNKPFFLMHHFKAPHDMFQNAKRYETYLEDATIPEPENLSKRPDGSEGSRGLGSGIRKDAPWHLGKRLGISPELDEPAYSKACYQLYLKRYLRCVKGVDDNVGRIIAHLRRTGELDNTIIIYTGDQGFFLGEHDLMDKRWMYEEAMRMPFIIHWPKEVKKGQTNDWLINNTDFAPTMLKMAGGEAPGYMQGRNFVDALKGQVKPGDWRTATYYRYWMHLAHRLAVPAHFGIRGDRYKLIFFYGVDNKAPDKKQTPAAWEFYDLKNDPAEMNNLYDQPEHATIIAEMKKELRSTREKLNETDHRFPEIQKVIQDHWNQ